MSLAMLGLGLAFTAWLVLRIGPDQVLSGIGRVGPRIIWLFAAYGAGTAIGGLPWRGLMPPLSRPTATAAVASRFAASGANVVLPLFGMGGEPVRLLWLPPPDRPRGIAAIVVDRLAYCASGAIVALAGVAALLHLGKVEDGYAIGAAAVALGTVAVAVVAAYLVAKHRLAGRGADLIHRLFGQRLRHLGAEAKEVERLFIELMLGPKGPLASALGVHVLGRVGLVLEVYIGLWALGAGSQPEISLCLATVPILVSPFASWVPVQAGVQEGTTAAAAAALGLDPALGVTLVLLQRIRQVAFVSLAGVLSASARSTARRSAAG